MRSPHEKWERRESRQGQDDAECVHAAYVAVASAEVAQTRLERNRKVVLLWSMEPSNEQREFMHLCTRDAQE